MDYTEWVYQGFLIHEYFLGNADILQQFYIAPYTIPNSLSQAGLAFLNFIANPILSGRLWILLYIGGWLWLAFLFLSKPPAALQANPQKQSEHRSTTETKALVPILFFALAAGTPFWNGFINFQFSLLIFSAYLYLRYIKGKESPWFSFLFSILLFFTHFSTFCIFLFIIFCELFCLNSFKAFSPVLLWGKTKLYYKHFLALSPSLGFSAWYFINPLPQEALKNPSHLHSISEHIMYKAYTLMKTGPFHNFILPDGKSFLEELPFLYWLGFAFNFCFALCLGLSLLILFLRVYFFKKNSSPFKSLRCHPPMLALGLCLGAYLILPAEFVIVNLGERFLTIAIALLIFIRPIKYPIGSPIGYSLEKFLYPALGILCLLLLPYYFYFLSWNALHIKKIAYRSDKLLVQTSRKGKDARKRSRSLYPNTRYAFFNHRLYSYQYLFEILENKIIHAQMPYHYSTSFLKKRKDSK